jgi:ribosomal subunit interface protein
MIDKVEVVGTKVKLEDNFRKYAMKRIGRLDRYLPKKCKKDVIARVAVSQVNRAHGNKYEIRGTIEVPGGKVIAARDEAGNMFAGVDILEAKLMGQVRRYKTESEGRRGRGGVLGRVFGFRGE